MCVHAIREKHFKLFSWFFAGRVGHSVRNTGKMALSLQTSVVHSVKRSLLSTKTRLERVILRRRIETEAAEEGRELEVNKCKSGGAKIRQPLTISCGNYAGLADGCAVVEYGGTAVMATAVGKGVPAPLDIPLTVSYHQKAAAIGRIPTNYMRRELGLSDYEILTSRAIDRSLRPMFQLGHALETQIICNPLALDGANFPEPLAINAASAALSLSDIPWNGPVAAARVALIDNEIVVNPTKIEMAGSLMNLMVTTTSNNLVVMLEGSFNNVVINDIMRCLKIANKYSRVTLETIENLKKMYGKPKRDITPFSVPQDIKEKMLAETKEALNAILTDYKYDKLSRDRVLQELYQSSVAKLNDDYPDTTPEVFQAAWMSNLKQVYRDIVDSTGKRCDGRGLTDVRPITIATGLYKSLHGSSVFKRGQTQVFCTVALDSPSSALRMDKISMLISGIKEKNFFLHYDFPAYATGEIGMRTRSNRREIGHGNLAEKALNSTIPESFPFTIRLTSEVLESNGSSSMASVCGGSLALLDAGVPIQYPVAGVAMGLLTNGAHEDFKILTDIMGMEDYLGDMDFKIAGTKTGYTALQLDVKVPGVSLTLLSNALVQGKKALIQVMKSMQESISKIRTDAQDNWPVIEEIEIPQYLKPKLFGSGGARLKKFELDVGVEVINFENDLMTIFAMNKAAMKEAKDHLQQFLSQEQEIQLDFGGIYTATVVEVKNHGCFVSLHPSIPPAFITLSQLDNRKVSHPSALGFEVGSQFKVKFFGRDPVSGVIRLSRKILLGRDESN